MKEFIIYHSFGKLTKECKINEFITAKFEKNGTTSIYIGDELFKNLIIQIDLLPILERNRYDENSNKLYSEDEEIYTRNVFQEHCNNLKNWVNNNYDPKLLSQAIPFLKRLIYVGESRAIGVFKQAISDKLLNGRLSTFNNYSSINYLDFFTKEEEKLFYTGSNRNLTKELKSALKEPHFNAEKERALIILRTLFERGDLNAKEILKVVLIDDLKKKQNYVLHQTYIDYIIDWCSIKDIKSIVICNKKPEKIEDWIFLAKFYTAIGSYEEALKIYEITLTKDPNNASYFQAKSAICFQIKKFKQAIALLKRAIKLAPQFIFYRNLLTNMYLRTQQYDKALENAKITQKMEQRGGDSLLFFGLAYFYKGNYSEALRYFDSYIENNMDEAITYFFRAKIFLKQGDTDKAIEDFRIISEEVALDAEYHEEFISLLNDLLKLNHKRDEIYYFLGKFFARYGTFEKAEKMYKYSLDLNHNNINSLYNLGFLYLKNDELIQAKEIFQKIIKIDPTHELISMVKFHIENISVKLITRETPL